MQHMTLRRKGATTLAAIAAAVICAIAAAPASAGEYAQSFCNSGTGSPNDNAWSSVGAPVPSAYCTPGAAFPWDGVYFNTTSLPVNGYGGFRADGPPGARYKDLSINLKVPYQSNNRRTFIESNGAYVLDWWNGRGGTSSYNAGGAFFTVDLNNSRYFTIGQACHGAPATGCDAGDFHFSGLRATLVDTTAPHISAHVQQGLFDSGRMYFRGVVPTMVDISDEGHGPAFALVQVDGAEVPGTREAWWASCNYRLANPCPNRARWTQSVNTAAYGDGSRTVRVIGDDGMGQSAFVERTMTFDNTAPVMGDAPAVDGKTISGDTATLRVSASDATSGVAEIKASIDEGPWETVDAGKVAVAGAGTHQVRFLAVDRAGNQSAEQVVSFTLQTPPLNQRVVDSDGAALPGMPGKGDQVKCDVGSPWTSGTRFEYRWLRDGAAIDGAVDQTYTVTAADAGRAIACRVVATNESGTTQRDSPTVLAGTASCFGKTGAACADPSGGGAAPAGASGGESAHGATYLGPPSNGANASNSAKFSMQGSRKRTVKFGRRIATVAWLRDEKGRPITGAQVAVLERSNVPGAEWVPARDPLVSDAQGRLRWIIPAKHSRTIRYAYRANLRNTEFQSTSDVTLTVFSRGTLRASRAVARNGQKVTFAGRLLSRPLPRGGVLIDVQARVGSRWQTFRTARARGTGRWKIAYRFRSTSGVQTYSFRARIREDSGYPYALSATRSVRVKVIG